ncbi:MAG: DNA primase, partial [candidate division WOR-3 bacterium]
MITKEQIDEIREKTDIVDLIGEYLTLKKVGKNYSAICPFHTEKDPSFYVNPEKKIFYCFGCQTGGDALTFVMKYENLDFPSALEKLGKRVGVNIVRGSAQDKYEDLYEANEFAANFYNLALEKDSDQRGLNYLRQRKITQDTIKRFKLGYAPPAGGLIAEARKKNFAIEKLIKIGLVSADRRWEHFRARVIFPIFNLGGRIIGFGGRGIDERIEPKYLNSPESPIFKKGDALFGLYQARDSIRARNSALLVEGYFDQISLFQAGILNVVAPLGTAFTESQALLLSRYCKQVYLFFDGDMSGIRAALRAIGLLINVQVGVKVVNLPEGKDPDSFVNEKGER